MLVILIKFVIAGVDALVMLSATFPDGLLSNYDLLAYGHSVVVIYQGKSLKIYSHAGHLIKAMSITVQSISIHRRMILVQEAGRLTVLDEAGNLTASRNVDGVLQTHWYRLADRILVLTSSVLMVLNKQLETVSTVAFSRPHVKVKGFAVTDQVGWPSLWLLWEDGDITVQSPFLLFPLGRLPQLEELTEAAMASESEDEVVLKLIAYLHRHGERSPHSLLKNVPWCPTLLSKETDLEYEGLWPCGPFLVAQKGAELHVFMPRNKPCFLEPQAQTLELIRSFELPCRIVAIAETGLILTQGGLLSKSLVFGPLKDPFKMPPLQWPARLELALSALPPAKHLNSISPPVEVPPFKPISSSEILNGCSFPSDLTSIPPCLAFMQAVDHLKRQVLPNLIKAGEEIRQRSLALEDVIRMQSSWSKQLDHATRLLSDRSQQLLTVHAQVMQREQLLLQRWQRVSHCRDLELAQLAAKLSQIQAFTQVVEVDEGRVLRALIQLQSDVISPK